MDDKLRREFAHSQQATAVVRRPTFEHHPSTTSLALTEPPEAQLPAAAPPPFAGSAFPSSSAYGRPPDGYAQPRQLAVPALYSYPSISSASSSSHPPVYGRAPASFGSSINGDSGRGLEEGLPTVYQLDEYAPAPLPELYSSRSYVGSVGGGGRAEGKTWGEPGHWPDPGYGAGAGERDDDDKSPAASSAWPSHLPRAGLAAPGQEASSQLPSADPSPDYGLVRPGRRSGALGTLGRTLRSLVPPSVSTRLFLSLVLLQSILVLAMLVLLTLEYYQLQAGDFRFLQATSEQRRLPVWLGVFALAHAWLFGMAVEGIRARNIIQVRRLFVGGRGLQPFCRAC